MSFKKKILIAFLVTSCLLLVAIGVRLYYFFSNIEDYSSFLAKNLELMIHRKVSIGKVKANIWGGLGLDLSDFSIKDRGDKYEIFAAQHLTFGLRIFPLLARRLVFYKIIVDNPKITIIRDEGGRVLDLLTDIPILMQREEKSSSAFRHLLTPSLSINHLSIRKGEIKSIDHSLYPYPLVTKAEDVEIRCVQSAGLRKDISFYLACRIPESGHQGLIKIQGRTNKFPDRENFSSLLVEAQIEIKDLPLQHFWPYYQNYTPFEKATAVVNLDINFRGNPLKNFQSSGYLKMKDVNFLYPKVFLYPLSPREASISYKLKKDDDTMKISGVDLRLDDCEFKGAFSLTGIKSKDFSLTAELRSNRFLWSRFRSYLPLHIMSPGLAKFWTEGMEEGWVEIGNASCSGRIRDFTRLKQPAYSNLIKGKAEVSGFGLNLLGGLITLKDLGGTVEIERGNLFMKGFSGTLRGSRLKRLSGSIANLYSQAVLSVKTTAEINMSQMLPMLLHDGMPEKMKPALNGLTSLKGKAQMNLALSGIRLSGQQIPPIFDGSLTLNKVGILHEKLPLPLTDLNGSIPFTDRLLSTKGIIGRLGNTLFNLRGRMKDWQEENPHFALALNSEINLKEWQKVVSPGSLAKTDLQGTGYLKGNIDGSFYKTCFSGDLDLTGGSYRFTEWLMKPVGTNNKFRYSGCYFHKRHSLKIDNLLYNLATTEVKGNGNFQFGEKPLFSASLSTKEIDLAQLHYANLPELKPVGIISGEVVLKGETGNWEKIDIKGKMEIDKAGLKGKDHYKPLFTLSTGVRFDKKTVELDEFSFLTGDSTFTVKGSMQGFANPQIKFDVSSPLFVLDDLLNLSEKIGIKEEEREEGKRAWLEGVLLEGNVSITQGKYRDFTFSNLKTKPAMRDGILVLKSLEWTDDKGRATSQLTFDLNWREHTFVRSDFEMKKIDVEKICGLLSLSDEVVSGSLNLKGELKSQFEEFRRLAHSLNGDMKLKLSDGRIKRFTVLSKILSILNLSQIFKLRFDEFITKGMPYKTITGTFHVEDGVITTEDLFLDSDQIKISAVGTINLVQDELNLTLGVEPLVTVDKILNNIPIVGRIIGGKDQSLIVSYFTVKGKIADPEVKVAPLKSLTRKVSSILEQLLGIPQQIIEMPQKILKPSESLDNKGL